MSPKFADFLWQLFLMAVFAFISFIAKEYWHSISSSSKTANFSEVDLKKIRYQFFFSMILLIVSIVAFANVENLFLIGLSVIFIAFAIVLLWGAFDAVYFPLEDMKTKTTDPVSKESSEKTD